MRLSGFVVSILVLVVSATFVAARPLEARGKRSHSHIGRSSSDIGQRSARGGGFSCGNDLSLADTSCGLEQVSVL